VSALTEASTGCSNTETPALSLHARKSYPRIVWGGLWGFLFMLPMGRGHWWLRGILKRREDETEGGRQDLGIRRLDHHRAHSNDLVWDLLGQVLFELLFLFQMT
jgi:hypothetical protein